MKTYHSDITEKAKQLIEAYPDLFDTSISENMKRLAPILKTKAGSKQAMEKRRDVLAVTIAQILSGQKWKVGVPKKRKTAKRRRFRRL